MENEKERKKTMGDSDQAKFPQYSSYTPVKVMKGEQLPDNAIRLSNEEAVAMHWRHIEKSHVLNYWAMKYGGHGMSLASMFTGYTIHGMWLDFFGFVGQRFRYSLVPCVLIPSILVAMFHKVSTVDRILQGDMNCSVCLELRSSFVLVTSGVIYPTLTVPMLVMWDASHRYKSVNLVEHMKTLKTNSFFKKQHSLFIAVLSAFGGFICERSIAQFEHYLESK